MGGWNPYKKYWKMHHIPPHIGSMPSIPVQMARIHHICRHATGRSAPPPCEVHSELRSTDFPEAPPYAAPLQSSCHIKCIMETGAMHLGNFSNTHRWAAHQSFFLNHLLSLAESNHVELYNHMQLPPARIVSETNTPAMVFLPFAVRRKCT